MRLLLSVSTAVLALAVLSSAQAQNIKPGMMPKGTSYNPYGPPTAATGLTQDLLVQSSSQLAASVVAQIVPGAIAIAPKSNAYVPGYAAWTTAGKFDPTGAKSAGAGLALGVLAGAALNPQNDPLLGAAISAGASAFGAFLGHAWASTPKAITPKVLAAASGVAAVQTLAAGGAQWVLQDWSSPVKALGTGVAVSGSTTLIAVLTSAAVAPAIPAIMGAGACAAVMCAAGDAISGSWKPPAINPTGVPGNAASNSNQNPGGQPAGNNTDVNKNTSGATAQSGNSNQGGGQQPAGSAGANTNTSAGIDPGNSLAPQTPVPGDGGADPAGAPTTNASNSNQDPGQQPGGKGGANANTSGAPTTIASNSNQEPGQQPGANGGANTNTSGATSPPGSGNALTPTPNPGSRGSTGTQAGAPAPTPPPAQPPIDLSKVLEGIGRNAPLGTYPKVTGLQPPIQQPPPPLTGTPPPPLTPPQPPPTVTGTPPPPALPPPQLAPVTPVGPTGAAAPATPTEVRMLCYKPTGLDQLVCTDDAAPFCADGSRVSLWSGSRSAEEQCSGKGGVWTSANAQQLCSQPPDGKTLGPEFCSPADCRPPGPDERSWQCTPTQTAAAPPAPTGLLSAVQPQPPALLPPLALPSPGPAPEAPGMAEPHAAPASPALLPPVVLSTPAAPEAMPEPPDASSMPRPPSEASSVPEPASEPSVMPSPAPESAAVDEPPDTSSHEATPARKPAARSAARPPSRAAKPQRARGRTAKTPRRPTAPARRRAPPQNYDPAATAAAIGALVDAINSGKSSGGGNQHKPRGGGGAKKHH